MRRVRRRFRSGVSSRASVGDIEKVVRARLEPAFRVLTPREACEHDVFLASVNVHRLTNEQGAVDGYVADLHVQCSTCGVRFIFEGVPHGFSLRRPMASVDRTELRIPIAPQQVLKQLLD